MDLYEKTIYARLKSLGFGVVALTILLLYKLVIIGFVNHDHYLALAQSQQRYVETETATRGEILVHDSSIDSDLYYPLAFDVKKFQVLVIPNQISDKTGTAAKLSQSLGLNQTEIYDKINNDKLYVPPLKKGLSLDEANSIIDQNISGVYVTEMYNRYYPEGTLASQLLGFVNSDGAGNYGVEGHYNDELKGKNGSVTGEQDTYGRMISLINQTDPEDGTSYVLTIDRSVQYYVEKKLAEGVAQTQADSGSVVIMDVKTGGIVAMASSPTYDPNNYSEQANTDSSVFINPVVAGLYEPGSIFKPLIVSAALDSGVLTTDMSENFGATVDVDGYTIHTAQDKAYGQENAEQILQHSDNVGMVWVGNLLGNEKMRDFIIKYGFSDKTGIDLDTEVAGNVPLLKNWRNINRATISFGQGVSVTPIELVAAYAAIANNGKYIYPRVVDKILYSDGTSKKIDKQEGAQIISASTATTMRDMLYSVVQSGKTIKSKTTGFKVGAKTGTAQIADSVNGGYLKSDNNLGIYVHSVMGMAPTDDPRFVMLVKLDKPKTAEFAESTAGPIFGDIASFLLNYYYRISPTE